MVDHATHAFNRRIEDGNLVLWRPGVTAWILVWGNDHGELVETRIKALKSRRAGQSFGEQEFLRDGVGYYLYRLVEDADDDRVAAAYTFAFSAAGHVQMAVYFDSEADLVTAQAMWKGVCPSDRRP